jgi:hypothetical protein
MVRRHMIRALVNAVVSSCLRRTPEKRFRRQMEEGYKVMAEENRRFAVDALAMARETLPDWD